MLIPKTFPDHVENLFLIEVPLDRLRDVLNELHGKADIDRPEFYKDGWHTAASVADERLTVPGSIISITARFHRTEDAALFRMFNEDIATVVTEADRAKVIADYETMLVDQAKAIAKEQFWKGTVSLRDPSVGIMGYARTLALDTHHARCPYTYIDNDDLPTSPRVTIR